MRLCNQAPDWIYRSGQASALFKVLVPQLIPAAVIETPVCENLVRPKAPALIYLKRRAARFCCCCCCCCCCSSSFFWGRGSSLLLHSACALKKQQHGMRSHSPRKGQRPCSSCLAAAKGALSESGSQGRRFYRIREGWVFFFFFFFFFSLMPFFFFLDYCT